MLTETVQKQFGRMGARVKARYMTMLTAPRIDVVKDAEGEIFDLAIPLRGTVPEVVDLDAERRHLVLMIRHGGAKNKYLCGHDERHWFVAAVPENEKAVKNVQDAMDNLRPPEARRWESKGVIRQGEWFFVPCITKMPWEYAKHNSPTIHRREPLSRGNGSKPHIVAEVIRYGGTQVFVNRKFAPLGIVEGDYRRLIARSKEAAKARWERRVRDAQVYARGTVSHPDHATIKLDKWHRVYMNLEHMAPHARSVVFLD